MLRPRNLIVLSTLLLAGAAWCVLRREPSPPVATRPVPKSSRVVMVLAHAPAAAPVLVTGKPRKTVNRPGDIKSALFTPAISFALRLQFVHGLGENLSPEQVNALLDYLRQPAEHDGLAASERHALKNDVILALRKQRTAPAGLTQVLISIYKNKDEDPVTRDYAIQHLSGWRNSRPGDLPKIDPVIWEAAGESGQTLAGTALLALARIADDTEAAGHVQYAAGPQFEKIQALARSMVANQQSPLPNRLTAMGVISQFGGRSAVLAALDRLNDAEPAMLQFVALATIKSNLDANDPATLSQCVAAVDSRLTSRDPGVNGAARELAELLKTPK